MDWSIRPTWNIRGYTGLPKKLKKAPWARIKLKNSLQKWQSWPLLIIQTSSSFTKLMTFIQTIFWFWNYAKEDSFTKESLTGLSKKKKLPGSWNSLLEPWCTYTLKALFIGIWNLKTCSSRRIQIWSKLLILESLARRILGKSWLQDLVLPTILLLRWFWKIMTKNAIFGPVESFYSWSSPLILPLEAKLKTKCLKISWKNLLFCEVVFGTKFQKNAKIFLQKFYRKIQKIDQLLKKLLIIHGCPQFKNTLLE